MFEFQKQQLAHLLTTTRGMAKTIKQNRKKAKAKEEAIRQAQENIKEYLSSTERVKGETVVKAFQNLIKQHSKYFDYAVYEQQEESSIIIFREEKHLEKLFTSIKEEYDTIIKDLPTDNEQANQLRQELQAILKEIYADAMEFRSVTTALFKKIRDQKRDHEHYRDKIYSLNKEYQDRKGTKRLKKIVKKEKHDFNAEEHHIHDIKQEIDTLQGHLKKGESIAQDLKALDTTLKKLVKEDRQEILDLKELIENIKKIVDYAVYHYFQGRDQQYASLALADKLHNEAGLWDSTLHDIYEEFKKLDAAEDEHERKVFRLMRHEKRETRHSDAATKVTT